MLWRIDAVGLKNRIGFQRRNLRLVRRENLVIAIGFGNVGVA